MPDGLTDTVPHQRAVPVARALAILAVVLVAGLLALYWQGFFVYDDWFYFIRAQKSGFAWTDWIGRVYFQHFAPGHRAANTLLQDLAPLDYHLALLAMVAALAASALLLQRTLDLLFGARWLHLALAFAFGMSVLFVSPLQWWSAGLQIVPTTLAGTLCAYAYVRHRRDGSVRWLAIAVVAIAFGLLFYVRPLLFVGYLLALRLIVFQDDLRPRAVIRALWHERLTWAALLAPGVLYVGYYLLGPGYDEQQGTLTLKAATQYVRVVWLRGLSPAFVGVHVEEHDPSTGQEVAVVAAQVLLFGFAAWTLWRKRAAWRAWALWLVVLGMNLAIVGLPRVPLFGAGVGYQGRYLTDLAWLFAIVVAFAASDRRTADPATAPPPHRALRLPGRPALVAGLAALALYTGLSVATTVRLNDDWPGDKARTYAGNLESGLARLRDVDRRGVVADGAVPGFILEGWIAPYNRVNAVARLADEGVRVDGPLRGDAYVVAADGTVERAVFATRWQLAAAAPGRDGTVAVAGGRVRRSGGALCVTAPAGTPALVEVTPRTPLPDSGEVYLWLGYRVSVPLRVNVFVDAGSGYPATTDRRVRLAPDTRRSLLWLNAHTLKRLRLDVPPAKQACLTRLGLGAMRQAGGGPSGA